MPQKKIASNQGKLKNKAKSENTETTLTEGQNTEELVRNKSMIDLEEMRRKLLSE